MTARNMPDAVLERFAAQIRKREEAEESILKALIADAREHRDSLYAAARRLEAQLPRRARGHAAKVFQRVIEEFLRRVRHEAELLALHPSDLDDATEDRCSG